MYWAGAAIGAMALAFPISWTIGTLFGHTVQVLAIIPLTVFGVFAGAWGMRKDLERHGTYQRQR